MTCGVTRRQVTKMSIFPYTKYSCAAEELTAPRAHDSCYNLIPVRGSSRTANMGRGARQSAPAVVCACLAATLWASSANASSPPKPTPSPTPRTDIIWGHCKTTAITNLTTPPTIQRELQDMWDSGGRCPRIDNDWPDAINTAHQIGFTEMVLIVGDTMNSVPDATSYAKRAVAIARAHPDAFIELGNECNLHGFRPAQYATIARAAYQAIKSAGLKNVVLLGSVGNSRSTVGNYSMLDWCKQLVRNGCVQGEAFDWANYHIYGNPAIEERWHHLFTPNSSGESCQTVLGNPPFAITEFGASLSKDCGGSEAVQALYVKDWMAMFAAQPQFRLGTQYAIADEAPDGSGYGLRRLDLSHRPSWDTYQKQAGRR